MINIQNCETCDFNYSRVCECDSSPLFGESIDVIADKTCSCYSKTKIIEPVKEEKKDYMILEKIGTVNPNVITEIASALKNEYLVFVFPNEKGECDLFVVKRGKL